MPNAAGKKLYPKPVLTEEELKQVAEQLANELGHDGKMIGLLLLLLDHLYAQSSELLLLGCSISTIKDYLFARTTEAADAQRQLGAEIRGKLLAFPKRKGAK